MATADPANNPQLNGLLAQDREKQSVAVHSFDPDAPPAQKAAAAGKGRSQLTNGNSKDDSPGGKGECALRFDFTCASTSNGPCLEHETLHRAQQI